MRTEDSDEPKKTRDRLINTRRGGIGDHRAEPANDPSNERCAEAGHRDHQSTHTDREKGEEEVLSTLRVGAGDAERLITK